MTWFIFLKTRKKQEQETLEKGEGEEKAHLLNAEDQRENDQVS